MHSIDASTTMKRENEWVPVPQLQWQMLLLFLWMPNTIIIIIIQMNEKKEHENEQNIRRVMHMFRLYISNGTMCDKQAFVNFMHLPRNKLKFVVTVRVQKVYFFCHSVVFLCFIIIFLRYYFLILLLLLLLWYVKCVLVLLFK